MGERYVSVVDLTNYKLVKKILVGKSPRHILINNNRLFVSLNNENKLAEINLDSTEVKAFASTKASPRTISLTEDKKYLLAVCYNSNMLQIFDANTLRLIIEYHTDSAPVGVCTFQKDNFLETRVCNYRAGNINVFTFVTFISEENNQGK